MVLGEETVRDDFRARLQEDYLQRLGRNPRYSLRAYARALGLHSGTLSQILNGKRPVTANAREKLMARIGMSPHDNAVFNQVSLDTFKVIADWYHYAILELTHIRGFRPSARWIARKLGISATEATIAVDRLKRLGYLEIAKDGRWVDAAGNLTTTGGKGSAAAFRKLQAQVLQMAGRALEEIPYERRDQSSLTVLVDTRALPEIREKIKQLRRELDRFIEAKGSPDAVYHLCISFYPVTREEES